MAQATDKATAADKAPRKPRSASTCKAMGDGYLCSLVPAHAGPHIDASVGVIWSSVVTVIGNIPTAATPTA